jgi:hypothetical protein
MKAIDFRPDQRTSRFIKGPPNPSVVPSIDYLAYDYFSFQRTTLYSDYFITVNKTPGQSGPK